VAAVEMPTSQPVTNGHPVKACDQISDAVINAEESTLRIRRLVRSQVGRGHLVPE